MHLYIILLFSLLSLLSKFIFVPEYQQFLFKPEWTFALVFDLPALFFSWHLFLSFFFLNLGLYCPQAPPCHHVQEEYLVEMPCSMFPHKASEYNQTGKVSFDHPRTQAKSNRRLQNDWLP